MASTEPLIAFGLPLSLEDRRKIDKIRRQQLFTTELAAVQYLLERGEAMEGKAARPSRFYVWLPLRIRESVAERYETPYHALGHLRKQLERSR